MVGSSGKEITDGLVESLRLDVDNNDPRSSCDARPTNGIEPNTSSTEDHDCVPGTNIRGVQDRAGARYNAAAEQRSLGERKLLGHDGELVFVDERAFGEAAQPKALKQADAVATQARGIGGPAQR